MFVFKEDGRCGVKSKGKVIIPALYRAIQISKYDSIIYAFDDEFKISLFDFKGDNLDADKIKKHKNAFKIMLDDESTVVVSPDFKAAYHIPCSRFLMESCPSADIFVVKNKNTDDLYKVIRLNSSKNCWEVVAEYLLEIKVYNNILTGTYHPKFKTGQIIVTENEIIDNLSLSFKLNPVLSRHDYRLTAVYGNTLQCPYNQYDKTGIYDITNNCILTSVVKYHDDDKWSYFINPETSDILWYNGIFLSVNDKVYPFTSDNSICYVNTYFEKKDIWLIKSNGKEFLLDISSMQKSKVYDCIEKAESEKSLYRTKVNNKYGYIDKEFNTVIPNEYDELLYIERTDNFIACKNKKYGRIDASGKIISPFIWDYMSCCDKGNFDYIQVEFNDKIGSINKKGKVIIQPIWDKTYLGIRTSDVVIVGRKEEKNILAFINIDDGRIILEDSSEEDFEVEKCFAQYVIIKKDGKTALYDTLNEKFECDYCLGSIVCEDYIIKINTLNEIREIRC